MIDDHIVEAPRGPRVSFIERRWRHAVERRRRRAAVKIARVVSLSPRGEPHPHQSTRTTRRGLAIATGVAGAIGLACSVVLAVGALLVALGASDGNGAYDLFSPICDVLVGPLRDVFAFSGTDARIRQALVAWGLGSIGYLMVGLFVQSFLRSRIDG